MSARERRADLLFAAYVAGGDSSSHYSLEAFARDLEAAGTKVSLGTLKRYSADFDWQARAEKLWASRQTERLPEIQRAAQAAELRRNRVGRALLGAGGRGLQALLEDDQRVRSMRPGEIARLIDLGVKVDLQAAEALQSRRDLIVAAWNDVIINVIRIFNDANAHPTPSQRASRFAEALDALATERINAADEVAEA